MCHVRIMSRGVMSVLAINNAKLELFQIHAVTKGTDAQAEVTVRLNEDGISSFISVVLLFFSPPPQEIIVIASRKNPRMLNKFFIVIYFISYYFKCVLMSVGSFSSDNFRIVGSPSS